MLKANAQGNQIIIDTKVRKVGEEVKSAAGIILGTEREGEVPLFGKVISVGATVDQNVIKLGDIVLLPNGHMKNVPDPRIIAGEMEQTDSGRVTWMSTHYENISVVYKED